MKNKISIYLFSSNLKYIFITLFFIALFIQIINLLEVAKIIEDNNSNIISILYLSILKLPTTILEVIPFVIIISTAFFYRNLISNNELISMRNIGYSIIDIYKPVGSAIFIIGVLFLLIVNPLSATFEKKFELLTSKDFSSLYSIKIKNNEIWIKNINKDKYNYIKFSNIDLKQMTANDIKIVEISNNNNNFYLARKGKLKEKNLELHNVIMFNIDSEKYNNIEYLNLNINFNNTDIINSISNYKFVPFYKYKKHLDSLKKFNLYSPEVSFYYISEIFKPFFLIVLGFIVMGFSSKFKRDENFFKILFYSILIGFSFFIFKEIISAFTIGNYIPFWFAYLIMFSIPLIFGIYQTIKIEIN